MSDHPKDKPWKAPYEIGYGKPPVRGRFVTGKSGNPRGRPKKSVLNPTVDAPTRDHFLSESDRLVTIREGENLSKIPMSKAVMRAEAVAALKGSPHAQKNHLARYERYRRELDAEIKEDHDSWREYVSNYWKVAPALEKAGEQPSPDWIHPDDIVFEQSRHVMVKGGTTQTRDIITRFRSLFLLYAEKHRRYFRGTTGASCHDKPPIFVAEVLAVLANNGLPKRLQLDDTQLLLHILGLQTLKKRELEQQYKAECSKLGIPYTQSLMALMRALIDKLGFD